MAASGEIRKYKELPDVERRTAHDLSRQGFGEGRWVYIGNARLADPTKNLQIRGEREQAKRSQVVQYAGAMSAPEVTFPGVILTKDGWLIDGVTRTAAAIRVKLTSFPAFVLDVSYENAPSAVQTQLRDLAAYMNLTNGRNLSKPERDAYIRSVMRENDSATDLWDRLGGTVSKGAINNLLNAEKAKRRAEKLGVDLNGGSGRVTSSHLATLGGRVASINDEPWKQFLTLIRDASLSTADTGNLAKELLALGGDQEKTDLIEAVRKSTGASDGRTRTKPSAARALRQHLGYILKFREDPGALTETSKDAGENHLMEVLDAASILREVARLQMDLNDNLNE